MSVVSHWLYSQIGILPNRNIRHFCLTPRPFEFVFSSRDRSGLVHSPRARFAGCVVFRDEHIRRLGLARRRASFARAHLDATPLIGTMRSTFRIIALAAAIGVLSAPITAMEFDLVDRCAPKLPFGSNAPRDDPFLPFAPPTRARLTTSSPRPPLARRSNGEGKPEDNMKCVLEELGTSTLVMFTYESPDDTHVNLKLYNPAGEEIYAQTDSARGSYGFTTELEGDYRACFYKTDVDKEDLANHKVRLDWKTGIPQRRIGRRSPRRTRWTPSVHPPVARGGDAGDPQRNALPASERGRASRSQRGHQHAGRVPRSSAPSTPGSASGRSSTSSSSSNARSSCDHRGESGSRGSSPPSRLRRSTRRFW